MSTEVGNRIHGVTGCEARVREARVTFSRQPFVRPLILSTGAIEAITQADAEVVVEVGGRVSEGRGCIYLSDLWAWPDPALGHEQRDAAMRAYCNALAAALPGRWSEAAHPLVLGLRLHEWTLHDPLAVEPALPVLARGVCASIFDAALHDAVGRALGRSAFDLYDQSWAVEEADGYFGGTGGAARAIGRMLQLPARRTSPAWWIVGKADGLEKDVRPACVRQGLFAFKLKIMGADPWKDAQRVVEVYQAARRWGVEQPRLTIDSNEANPDAASVAEFLDILATLDGDAYARLEMIEQPTGRDIGQCAFDWRAVASRKPVMVDEGLTALDRMPLAREQGWSGFALKTCKGHSFVLTAAAWACEQGLALSLQDLTNPGLSAIHAGLFAARVPTVNGVELNSPQFTPAANAEWLEQYPGLFWVREGQHELPGSDVAGLGGAF
jgi:L-alanine-DL-glutamate epimerase-like enolase superfamily enzyme